MPPPPRPFIPVPSVARLEMIYTVFSQVMENVVYLYNGDNWSTGKLTDLATNAATAWDAEFGPIVSASVTLSKVRATDMSEFPAAQVEIPAAATGNLVAGALPGNVTAATKFSGGLTGRSTRGRAYFVGLTAAQVVDNHLATGTGDDINNAWTAFFAALNTVVDGHPLHVVVSFVEDGAWRTEGLVTNVISYTTENNTDSQRRRLTGRGL